jgi:hypothetical protein
MNFSYEFSADSQALELPLVFLMTLEDEEFNRRQGWFLIVSALRVIRDVQRVHNFSSVSIIRKFAQIYLHSGNRVAAHVLFHAANEIQRRRGGR